MWDQWCEWLSKLNKSGIPLLFVKDPTSGTASVSLTLMVVSFTICVIGVIGRCTQTFEIDKGEAFNLLILTSSLYFGRKVSGLKGVSMDTKSPDKSQENQ